MMVRTALGTALALCLASACSSQDPSDPNDPDPSGGDPNDPDDPDGDDPGGGGPGPVASGLVRGGQLHRVSLAAPVGPNADHGMLLGAVEKDLVRRVGPLEPGNFDVRGDHTSASPSGARLRHVDMVQRINGVPVDGTYLQLTVREDGGAATVLGSSFRVYRNPKVDTNASLSADEASALARSSLRLPADAPVVRQELQVRDMRGRLELVWATGVKGSHDRAMVIASGARAGQVVKVDGRVYENVTGTVTGFSVTGGAPGGLGVVGQEGLGNLTVTTASGLSVNTDGVGAYAIVTPDGDTLTAALNGRASTVFNEAGANISTSAVAAPVVDLTLGSATSGELELSQVTAFTEVEQTRNFLEANGVPSEVLGGAIPTFVNIPDFCNAFYSFDGSINFFQSGGGCNNSATDSIVTHEYGHFVDDMLGGITNGGLSEGWGDLLSCLRLGIPELGFDLFPGEALRNCENDYVFPPDGEDPVHTLGQAWMGFGWLVRQGLIAKLGETEGEALARALIIPSLNSNAADILAAVREVFLRDDDDGDLTNETPNWDVLYPAALHHGLTIAIETDLIAPASVTDLAVESVGATSVTLTWTAPGDDDNEGTASSYEVRFSTEPITPENFPAATLAIAPPTPAEAGTTQSMSVTAPPETTLFFAMVTRDEQFNVSGLSNVVEATTEAGTTIFENGAEDGLGGFTATGLWHVTERRASEGVASFWYGDEATGTYDTPGAANSGSLTSPIIDLTSAADPILSYAQFLDIEEGTTFDLYNVTVTDVDDPANVVVFPKDVGNTGGAFAFKVLPLNSFAGSRIQISFNFDTVDELFNDTEGWFIDDVRVIVTADECAHDVCEAGGPLEPGCSVCASTVCGVDPFCCEVFWDRICVQEAEELCGDTCAGCSHDLCAQGDPLEASCDPCATTVCDADPFCCDNAWDARCVTEASQLCGLQCEECTHDLCDAGGPLATSCDPCVAAVCESDPYCCSTAWDDRCVDSAADTCGRTCDGAR
jgi:hypothetical protein